MRFWPVNSRVNPLADNADLVWCEGFPLRWHSQIRIGCADPFQQGTAGTLARFDNGPAIPTRQGGLARIESQTRFLLFMAMACVTPLAQYHLDLAEELNLVEEIVRGRGLFLRESHVAG